MMRIYQTPRVVKWCYPKLTWSEKSENAIFLTFDDGPHPVVTPWVMDQLEKVNAQGTFFCQGLQVEKHPAIILALKDAGHRLGNHTYSHVKGSTTDSESYLQDINKCDLVFDKMGVSTRLFRPPYGKIKRDQIRALQEKKIVMWSHVAYDFDSGMNVKHSLRILKRARPGSIIVFHDTPKAEKKLKEILPAVLDHYVDNGFSFEAIK